MSREKQIEEMAKTINKSDILCHTCGESTYTYCAEAVAEYLHANGYRKQEWISADEALPEESGVYAAYDDNGNSMTLEQAIELLKKEYERAKNMEYVKKPLAWALFQVWKKADKMKGGKE